MTLLINVFHTTTIDAFKISAAVTISHICKLNQAIFPTFFESITCKKYCQNLIEAQPWIQQAFITMLNIELNKGNNKILVNSLAEDPTFIQALHWLLIHDNIVIKGKAIITALLLFKMNPIWMVLVQEIKFYVTIDRMLKDNSKYIQYCLLSLIEGTIEATNDAIKMIQNDFDSFIS